MESIEQLLENSSNESSSSNGILETPSLDSPIESNAADIFRSKNINDASKTPYSDATQVNKYSFCRYCKSN